MSVLTKVANDQPFSKKTKKVQIKKYFVKLREELADQLGDNHFGNKNIKDVDKKLGLEDWQNRALNVAFLDTPIRPQEKWNWKNKYAEEKRINKATYAMAVVFQKVGVKIGGIPKLTKETATDFDKHLKRFSFLSLGILETGIYYKLEDIKEKENQFEQ